MTILTISKRGTLKLPKDVVAQLNGVKHVQLRQSSTGIVLTPVQIQVAIDIKAIPDGRIGCK